MVLGMPSSVSGWVSWFFFFFQAEDGIRDVAVTGVQTCALPIWLQPMISVGSYIDFLLKFTLAFGLVFELPLAITLAARMGVVTPKVLAKNRKYAILGAFIAGAVLTPTPDAFNQTLMAGPLILLYEVGIICARIFGRKPKPVPVAEETPA